MIRFRAMPACDFQSYSTYRTSEYGRARYFKSGGASPSTGPRAIKKRYSCSFSYALCLNANADGMMPLAKRMAKSKAYWLFISLLNVFAETAPRETLKKGPRDVCSDR